ncbi:DUF5615 family PIN-like protein [Rhodohalobacter sp. 8-1]|uniref:DUF5615 family PIN-like protein n=1 Tax=Rhodohalobacter sp. 8-1 TaxID=3131972 RepID=UPI0030EEC1C6
MKFLIDMNLSPDWIDTFQEKGFQAIHWSAVGALNASDEEIMEYAYSNGYIVFTHDLDFGDILAATGAKGPSVIQVRTNNIAPESLKVVLFKAIHQFNHRLGKGALITLDPGRMRARILPLKK